MSRKDTMGQQLLRERVALAKQRVFEMIETPVAAARFPDFPWVVTGIGSSEAHAKYMVYMVNRIQPGSAVFWPTASFYSGFDPRAAAQASLIVFSQGVSSNARISLRWGRAFKDRLLFTASDATRLRGIGKRAAADVVEAAGFVDDHVVLVPEFEEFSILLRVVGPLCGYLAVIQWLRSGARDLTGNLPVFSREVFQIILDKVGSEDGRLQQLSASFLSGCAFNFCDATQQYAQNLAYKRVEGIFGGEPIIRDLFQYAHGPFQQQMVDAEDQWIFGAGSPAHLELATRVTPMFERTGSQILLLQSPLPEPYAILYFECLLNEVLLDAIGTCKHSQVDWPGKGQDGEGYLLDAPFERVSGMF